MEKNSQKTINLMRFFLQIQYKKQNYFSIVSISFKFLIKFIYNKGNDINDVFIKTLSKELENKIYKESLIESDKNVK